MSFRKRPTNEMEAKWWRRACTWTLGPGTTISLNVCAAICLRFKTAAKREAMKPSRKSPADRDLTHEEQRLNAAHNQGAPWKMWGPYLSERQWGTVSEDYSQDGN